jgi:hypothetical protein
MQQTNFINTHEQILRANRQTFQITIKLGIPLRFCWQIVFILKIIIHFFS